MAKPVRLKHNGQPWHYRFTVSAATDHILKRGMAQIECGNEVAIPTGGAIVDGKHQIDRLGR